MITERTAAELVSFIRELWPKWNPPEFQTAELTDWMVRRLTDVGSEEAMLALNAEAEEQQSKQFSKSQPIVKALKTRLTGLQTAATSPVQNDDTDASQTEQPMWTRRPDGQFEQEGLTADEWADSWDRIANELANRNTQVGRNLARQCRERAKRLRAGQFAGNPFGFPQTHTAPNEVHTGDRR